MYKLSLAAAAHLLIVMLMSHIPDHNTRNTPGAEIIISEAGDNSGAEGKPIDLLDNGWLTDSQAGVKSPAVSCVSSFTPCHLRPAHPLPRRARIGCPLPAGEEERR